MFKINTGRKLKIWTIVTQALILVGFGHGILNFAVIEIFWFPYVTKHPFNFDLNASFEAHLPVIGLTTLTGQILLITSMLQKKLYANIIFQMLGLLLLWLSIYYFVLGTNDGGNVHIAGLTIIPLMLCTVLVFLGHSIKRFYVWIIDM